MGQKPVKWVEEDHERKGIFWPSDELKKKAWLADEKIYEEAGKDPVAFWAQKAREALDWIEDWSKDYEWDPPYYKWFVGGKLNACYNAIDRHVKTGKKNKEALIWIPELPDEQARVLTYDDLYREVNKFANVLKGLGVKKGDRVGIYLPLIPEVQIAMLACARVGAVHSVVFSAFSGESLRIRMVDADAKVLITADGYYRRGKKLNLKAQADKGVEGTNIRHVVVVRRLGLDVDMVDGRDSWWHELMKGADSYCELEAMDSEDMLFILYTSGTTGKPKGVVHTIGGYLTQAYWTTKWDFDIHDEDVLWCTADIGWITGHTYACYGPFTLGATQLVYEGAPDYPQPDRWWQIIEKHGVTILYTAPTAIRALMRAGDKWIEKHDLSSLRLLGTVGEPIDREAWMWYFNKVGGGRCPVIDTWWQTETGGTLINALPGIGPFIPTVAGRSFPGTRHKVLDNNGNTIQAGEGGFLVQMSPFSPGMLRGIYGDPEKYKETYWSKYGEKTYFTDDGARLVDGDGNIRVTGRVDDVMQVAGHRLANAEVEDALNRHDVVVESAVVGEPHPIKGEVPLAFVILRGGSPSKELEKELIDLVRERIGPTARPSRVIFVEELPKTRSGKIMRRVLKSLIKGEPVGDVTTLGNPESVEKLKGIISDCF